MVHGSKDYYVVRVKPISIS